MMRKNWIVWAVIFAAALLMILYRCEISRYVSAMTALLAVGTVLALTSGTGLLLELYRRHSPTPSDTQE